MPEHHVMYVCRSVKEHARYLLDIHLDGFHKFCSCASGEENSSVPAVTWTLPTQTVASCNNTHCQQNLFSVINIIILNKLCWWCEALLLLHIAQWDVSTKIIASWFTDNHHMYIRRHLYSTQLSFHRIWQNLFDNTLSVSRCRSSDWPLNF